MKPISTTAELLDAAIRQGVVGMATLARHARDGLITLVPLAAGTDVAAFDVLGVEARRRGRPVVVLIGDDDDLERGPGAWPVARRAIASAPAILVHAAAAEVSHYDMAVLMAGLTGGVLIIECSSTTRPAWEALVAEAGRPGTRIAAILPPPGHAHPARNWRTVQ